MSVGWWCLAWYGSGMAAGWLACWYVLVKPMARVLGWEKDR